MPKSYYDDVRRLHLFEKMSRDKFDDLMRGSYVQNFPPQIDMIHEGETSDFLHVVLSGAVELFSSWNNRETTMAIIRPISTFILAATIKNAPYLMSARTIEKSRIALIPSQDVRAAFDADNDFARAIVTELAQCYRGVVKSHKNVKLRTSLERLANYLLRQSNSNGSALQFDLPFEKRTLSSLLGMTPENLSRAFKSLSLYGVSVDGRRIIIGDIEVLRAFAKPNPLIDGVPAQE
ncbi:helix-turn-helix domain-containing protein [Marivivens marinus]|uniref:helix-turn-helix domain-containing protein n=1 Tax=Marivivens marinus TaxID=3110173 RepID=UPI003B84AAC9